MRDSKSSGKKSIKEVQELRARKAKLERVSSDIAERKKAEEELRQSEEFLANMIDALDDPVFVKDEQHRWVVLNDAACKVMGRSREELIGKSDYDLFPKEQADVFWGRDDSVLRSGKTDINEEEITWHGKLHTISTKKSLFTDSVTRKKFVVGTIRDITERKHAEQALRESEQKLRLLFEGAYDLISLANADAKTLWANPAWRKIFGAESEYKADPFSSIHPDDRERVAESWQDLISGAANIKNLEYRYKVPKGQYLTFESCAYPVIIDQQRLYYVVARDVTERKRAEQALRESEETARAILNATYDLAFLIDTEGTMLALNETFAKRFDKRVDELIGSCVYDLLSPDVAAKRKAQGDNVIRSGQPLRFEDIRQGRHLDSSIYPVFNADGRVERLAVFSSDITERKRADEAVRESEEKFRNLAELSPNMIFINQHRKVIYVNKKCVEIMGYRKEEFYSNDFDFLSIVAPEYRDLVEKIYVRHAKDKESTPIEYALITKAGERIEMLHMSTLITYRGETAILGTDINITERKRAEEKIEAERKKLETYIETMVDGVSITDANGVLIQVNKALAKIHNYSPDEMVGKQFIEFVAKRDIPKAQNIFVESIRKKKHVIKNLEIAGLKKDGTEFSATLNIRNLWDKEGKLASVISVVRDITERKKAEEALRESEEKLRNVVERANDGIAILQDGLLKYVNPRTTEIIGYTVEEMINTPFARYVHPDELPKVTDIYKRRMAGEEIGSTYETVVRRKDGTNVHIEVSGGLITYEGETADFAFARDITERKKAEQKLLEDQVKLKSLASELLLAEERERHRIATELHDRISQSLVISKMNLEALRKSEYGKKIDDTLGEICNSLAQTIADTRTLTFDLSSPILYELGFETAVAEWLTEQIQDSHGIATQFEDDGRPKPLDDDISVLLFRNVRELLINVVKHAHAHKVKVAIRRVGKKIQVSVEDDGGGFELAETMSMATKRAEFGLFSIRQRLEQLGGHLEIKSELGRGCKVTMMAPLKKRID